MDFHRDFGFDRKTRSRVQMALTLPNLTCQGKPNPKSNETGRVGQIMPSHLEIGKTISSLRRKAKYQHLAIDALHGQEVYGDSRAEVLVRHFAKLQRVVRPFIASPTHLTELQDVPL